MKKKMIIPLAVALIMVFCIMPVTALADDHPMADKESLDISTLSSGDTVTVAANANVTITGANTNIQINCGAGANVTLNGVSITNSTGDYSSISFTGSGNKLILAAGTTNTLVGGTFAPAVRVEGNTSLTIEGTGTLNATGGGAAAGIGGSGNSGSIIISSGTINATGGTESGDGLGAAGIGGGLSGSAASVEITGGYITAIGGNHGAGIGGGQFGSGGTITISGGTVYATGVAGGAGIGGGFNNGMDNAGGAGDITISGGTVYADGQKEADDIGNGVDALTGGTLSISGGAAVFAANDRFLAPVSTTTHTHTTYAADTETSYGIAIPSAWTPTFGSYLRLHKLSYNAGSGSGTAPAEATQLYQTTTAVAEGSGLSRQYYKFSGWNTKADGTGVAYAAGGTFTFSADTTLYAQWTAQPELKSSVADGKIYTGGRITLTPNIPGGTWSFDASLLSRDGNTFTALKTGTTRVTYTVEGQSTYYDITALAAQLPKTGQDGTWIYVLSGLAAAAFAAAVSARKYKRHIEK